MGDESDLMFIDRIFGSLKIANNIVYAFLRRCIGVKCGGELLLLVTQKLLKHRHLFTFTFQKCLV